MEKYFLADSYFRFAYWCTDTWCFVSGSCSINNRNQFSSEKNGCERNKDDCSVLYSLPGLKYFDCVENEEE